MYGLFKTFFILILSLLLLAACSPSQEPSRLETFTIDTTLYEAPVSLYVWLPTDYDPDRKEAYPVLYMTDGQNIFSTVGPIWDTSWNTDISAEKLIQEEKIPPVVIVGIGIASMAERSRTYLPWPDEYLTPYIAEPDGKEFPDFLAHDVIPAVENRFHVQREQGRYLGGSSYGGLITFYTAMENPNLFNGYLVESPSLYVDEKAALSLLQRKNTIPDRMYLGIGTHETAPSCEGEADPEAVEDVEEAARLLKEKGMTDKNLMVVVEECGLHQGAAWARRFPDALKFLLAEYINK